MKENFKLAAKIGAKTLAKWGIFVGGGWLLSIICFLIVLFTNSGLAVGGDEAGAIAFVANLFSKNIWGFVLFLGAPIFMTLYFMFANKMAIQNSLHLLWENKAGDYITSKVRSLVERLSASNNWAGKATDKTVIRAKMLDANRKNPDASKLQRTIINYGMKKVRLDDVDMQDENFKLSDLLADRFNEFISEAAKPSMAPFWILAIIQGVLLFLAI